MRCYWCNRGEEDAGKMTLDHVIPRSKGGSNRQENKVLSCAACNGLKGNMNPVQWAYVMENIPEWWKLGAMRGPRGEQLVSAMIECGFEGIE